MALVIKTEKTNTSSPQRREKKRSIPLFSKVNYILMALGVVILVAGYFTLVGGGAEEPKAFSDAIFNTRRMVYAPILMLLGLVIEIVAIMYYPRKRESNPATPPEA